MDALHKLLQVTREEKKEKDLFDDDEAQKVFLQVDSPSLLKVDGIRVSSVDNRMKNLLVS